MIPEAIDAMRPTKSANKVPTTPTAVPTAAIAPVITPNTISHIGFNPARESYNALIESPNLPKASLTAFKDSVAPSLSITALIIPKASVNTCLIRSMTPPNPP
jgi:hypothetical protein